MADKKTAPLQLNVDACEVLIQIGELLRLLELPASSFEGISEHVVELFFNRVRSLIDNVIFSDFSATVSTTDAGEICIKVKIIGLVEHLTSTVRAHGTHGLHEYILSTVGEIKE
ncbi:TPA: hypothetical protein N5O15_000242 [Enterobacter hormaechei subsp. xiangfangensis]|nr:hypothetical protein ABR28_09415 [Enterobacter hormaechei subsp. hoffmannii]KLW40811.1 hypothetical protein SK53_01991 [Enterobacter sp. MGH119]HCM9487036.1 hypothetical protein [Enterobacter hormaechei subsp. xiangfangensis]